MKSYRINTEFTFADGTAGADTFLISAPDEAMALHSASIKARIFGAQTIAFFVVQ